ncbi:MAG: sulfatase [Planctomycetales bacterium]|nr:sulfatase [Planctomycetales bacterium]
MIISDDQCWNDFGFMGHTAVETPHLDRLAAQGAVFRRGYVPSSLCRPSLASMVTGLYPHEHLITGNDPPKELDRNVMLKHIRAAPSLPRLLGAHGYRSFQSGKWWEGNYREGGFSDGMTHGDTSRGGRHGDEGLTIGREGMKPVVDFLDEVGERPFLLWYAPFLPHQPHNPPARLAEKYASKTDSPHVARYWAMCEWFDETCGELLDQLDVRGLSENTIVVFVVDNGWIQQPDHAGYAPRSKRSPYDGGLRTPILVRWPGVVEPVVSDTPVSSIDLAPTILKACRVEVPPAMTGIDLVALANAEAHGEPVVAPPVFGSTLAHDIVDIDRPAASVEYRYTVDGPWKLIVPARGDESPELYNVVNDPWEQHNLAAEEPERVDQLRALIDAWWTPAK